MPKFLRRRVGRGRDLPDPGSNRHRVVVVGGGFGGLPACRFLSNLPIDVTLIDRRNHHLFQPLLYQVATGILSPGQIAPPLRHILRGAENVNVELAEVTEFDLERKLVHAVRPRQEPLTVSYDSLIVAAGAGQSYFGHDEFALHAPGMKTIDDAIELRRRILGAFEMAETAADPEDQREWLTIAVVGAGPTGVEIAGQIRELASRSLTGEFRRLDPASLRVLVLDAGKEPLPAFGDNLSGRAARELKALGVELRMGAMVTGIDETGVEIKTANGAERIPARTVVWAAGVEASPLAKQLGAAAGAKVDHAGRVEPLPDLTLPGHPEVFVVGDMVALNDLPGVAEVAMQGSLHAANKIVHRLRGDTEARPFEYRDLGSVAAIGRFRAICSIKGLRLSGFPGWVVWSAVHLVFLNGWGNRATTLLRWYPWLLGHNRPERVFSVAHTGGDLSTPPAERAHLEPGGYPAPKG
ncbi:MAG: NAD(P)/FAD-dependent oxidoreductase [Gemmatimonas sp.]|nr:NAD(P)/FAD-dependent oxidoreductase [Gemmatimonas sp.]